MAWVSPTGHNDPDSGWNNETRAYDEDTGNYSDGALGKYLELTLTSAISCDKIQVFLYGIHPVLDCTWDIDVYYDGDWHNIYSGVITDDTWVEKTIPDGTKSVSKARLKADGINLRINEFDFWEVEAEEYSKSLTEALAIVDTKLLSTGIAKTDTLSIETALDIFAPGKQLITNIVSIGDAVTRKMSKTFTEVLSVADTLTRTTVIKRVITDSLSLVDNAAKGLSKMIASSIAISATIKTGSAWCRTLTEAISIGDVRTLATKTIKSEVISVVDAVLKGSKRTITSIISLIEIYGGGAQYKLVLSEVLSIKSQLPVFAENALILTEIVAVGDAVTRKISKTLSEVLSVTDTLNRANTRVLSEVISLVASAKIREIGERIIMYLHSRTLSVYLHIRTLTMKIHRRRTSE